jgi:hypothetical protein
MHLVMCQNPQVVFLSHKQIVQHAIPSLVAKTMEQSVILTLDSCVTTVIFFDLWMFSVRQLLSLYFRFYKVTMLESTNATGERRMWVYF